MWQLFHVELIEPRACTVRSCDRRRVVLVCGDTVYRTRFLKKERKTPRKTYGLLRRSYLSRAMYVPIVLFAPGFQRVSSSSSVVTRFLWDSLSWFLKVYDGFNSDANYSSPVFSVRRRCFSFLFYPVRITTRCIDIAYFKRFRWPALSRHIRNVSDYHYQLSVEKHFHFRYYDVTREYANSGKFRSNKRNINTDSPRSIIKTLDNPKLLVIRIKLTVRWKPHGNLNNNNAFKCARHFDVKFGKRVTIRSTLTQCLFV